MAQPAQRLGMVPPIHPPPVQPPGLLDRVRAAVRARHYSIRTEEAYVGWVRRFILFHSKRHPAEMGESEINRFLTHLAVQKDVAASTQNQALSAILFLYQVVLEKDLDRIDGVVRAKKLKQLNVVLTRERGPSTPWENVRHPKLAALLLYGGGLRLLEALRLRVKDIDFASNQITVRDGNGQKDRVTMLPAVAKELPAGHLKRVRQVHQQDLHHGLGRVYLPDVCPGNISRSSTTSNPAAAADSNSGSCSGEIPHVPG
jgi:integrase